MVRLVLTVVLVASALPAAETVAQGSAELEPNDDRESATPVMGAFEVAGDASASDDWFAWSVDDDGRSWTIAVEGPTDRAIGVEVFDVDGPLDGARAEGGAAVRDLVLGPGSHFVRVQSGGADPLPYTLQAEPQDQAFDAEPNDDDNAQPIADGVPAVGRMGRTGSDEDLYQLDVPSDDAMLRDVRLTWPTTTQRMLCLLEAGRQLVCHKDDDGDVDILDLALEPGSHLFEVSGASDPGAPYTLTVDAARPAEPGYEAEPNDTPQTAAAFDLELGIEGRGSAQDPDLFRATVSGETQLWRIAASGPSVGRLSWIRPAGEELTFGRPEASGAPAVLDDLLLPPGDHYFRLYNSDEAAYTLSATPLGAPDDHVEREPNSTVELAEPLVIGERRVGRLATSDDIDHYRFTVSAPERLRLRLGQPADADIQLVLQNRGHTIVQTTAGEVGATIDLDLLLQPGDHLVRLVPYAVSEETYELSTERLDAFDRAVDQEPNDELAAARPVPASLRWHGSPYKSFEPDWYVLPAGDGPGPLRISVSPEAMATIQVSDGVEDISPRLVPVPDEPGTYELPDPPVGTPLYLNVLARTLARYDVEVSGPGWEPLADPVAPAVSLDLELETDTVAAYWPQRQRVAGRLVLSNDGAVDQELELRGVTTHHAWALDLPDRVSVAAGASTEVPIGVEVQPDVWAGEPVRVAAAATAPGGGRTAVSVDVQARPEAAPVAPSTLFSVPAALLGGLNVASTGLGAVPVEPNQGSVQDEEMLYDDVTPDGVGMWVSPLELPQEFVVDLAGDAPIPIVGTMLHPQAERYDLRSVPATFELLLSSDGSTWATALTGELSPAPTEQSFVLAEPVSATHAMLRIVSLHGSAATTTLGEWKVIAQPGVAPDPMPSDLAEPSRGGHVVRFEPFFDRLEFGARILDDDLTRDEVTMREGDDRFELVLGFKDARAAQLIGLGWQDPAGSVPGSRVERLDVEVALDGAMGPWQAIGEWALERGADGSVEGFEFESPTWARYVRLSSPLEQRPPDRIEMPGALEAHERPASDDYRSVLGEWGYTSALGPYEWTRVDGEPTVVTLDEDAGDTRDEATPLLPETQRTDSVEAGTDVDWYEFEAGADTATLELTLAGIDVANVRLALFESEGDAVAVSQAPGSDPGTVRFLAAVEPGSRYLLRVEQPPLNTVIAYDTSDSMVPYLPFVRQALRAFTREVVPGMDAVQLLPFEEAPLLPTWQDQPDVLLDAVNNHVRVTRSSGAEAALKSASELLADRDGTRAILLLTDAETSSYGLTPVLWPTLAEVEPVIFAVNLGATSSPASARDLMQGWAQATGGHYVYASTHAAVDRAFERMTTWLRRPAIYELRVDPTDAILEPARLEVVAPPGQAVALARDTAIGIIVDTSGSMRKRLDGERRINIAKDSLRALFRKSIAPGTPVAVRSLGPGGKKWRCRSRLEIPLAPLEPREALAWVKKVNAPKRAGTPLVDALGKIRGDLKAAADRIVVVITDGNESCGGDPLAAVEALEADGIRTTLNIVGFALDDEDLKTEMAGWAERGNGRYFDATGADDLAAAIRDATAAPFEVYVAATDELAGSGTVGGAAIELDPGRYRVEVMTQPSMVYDVDVGWGEVERLELPVTQ